MSKRTLIIKKPVLTRTVFMLFTGHDPDAEFDGVHATELSAQVRSDFLRSECAIYCKVEKRVVDRTQLENILEDVFPTHADFERWQS